MPASLLHRPHRPCAIIQAAGRRQQQQQRPPRQPAATPPPPLGRRRLLSVLPMPLLWLQWRGCDQGGAYSTGVGGEPGKDCQVIYQPAFAAEQRFAERQRATAAAAAAPPTQQPPAVRPAAENAREEGATVRKEQAAYDREALRQEQERRTADVVDAAWQSLE